MSDFNLEKQNISCETIEEWLIQAIKKLGQNAKLCRNGDVSIDWIRDDKTIIETQQRAYQREKVSSISFQQEIMRTVLVNKYTGIPEVHIRILFEVIDGNMRIRFELVDGQQRITSITDFLDGKYNLGKDMIVDGNDISGLGVDELKLQYPEIYDSLLEYRISCKWYIGLTDSETAHNFIYVLNNVNDMKPQELRNALLGVYSTFIRETVRSKNKKNIHDLFKRNTDDDGKQKLKYFSPNFALKQRMEVDEWLSELIYLWKHDPIKGISHKSHFKWVESSQSPTGEYGAGFSDEVKVKKLLSTAQSIITAVPAKYKGKLNPMTSMMLVLYGNKLKEKYGGLVFNKYVHAFFDVYERWSYSETGKQLYHDRTTINGNPMPPFNQLFGGKNANAIGTIFAILEEEMLKNVEAFGVLEIDQRNFKRKDVVQKWREQDCLCYYTKKPLDEDNIVGDHLKARSQGGRTEWDNLVVTSRELNLKKLNMSEADFKKLLKKEVEKS